MFTGDPALGRALGLRAYRTHTFFNGPIECRLLRFHLDESARRARPGAACARRGIEAARDAARRRRCSATGCARTCEPTREVGATQRRRLLPRLRCRHAGVRVRHRRVPATTSAGCTCRNTPRQTTVAQEAVRARRDEALATIPDVLGVPAGTHGAARAPAPERRASSTRSSTPKRRFHVVREGPLPLPTSISRIISTRGCSSTTA